MIHPRREGRSKKQIGKKGKSNGHWIVGIKLGWLINDQGEVVDWTWLPANEADNAFRRLASGYDGEMVALSDRGFRQKDAPTQNIKCCEGETWNECFTIESNLSWVTELFHSKKLYHRVKTHLQAHLAYLAALMNCLLRLTEHKRSLADFVL
ncbi:MAG TPA: transposase [Roseiflexaceae bacterium]|nr:transposase [Roseiflexaceae bacterium]